MNVTLYLTRDYGNLCIWVLKKQSQTKPILGGNYMALATFTTSAISATSWTRTIETPAAAHKATAAAMSVVKIVYFATFFPIFFSNILYYLTPLLITKVNIDIGHAPAFLIQESFEKQAVLKRINIGYSQTI